jgi:hypothetical protein
MSVVDSPQRYAGLRELLRTLEPPFLLRHYDATPENYEQVTDERASPVLAGLTVDVEWFWQDPLPSVRECLPS